MNTALEPSPEILKLAHQLGVPPDRLDFLAAVGAEDLRALRKQIGEALFNADKHHFSKVVTMSKIVPGALAAKITEHALQPLIAARTAELLEPARAADMVVRLSDRYLADVSVAMDPARAPDVIAQLPAERVAMVGRELARRGEWVVMGGFVALVSDEALHAAVVGMTGEQLLRVGFVLEDLSRLDDIAQLLADDQLDQMLAAAIDCALWRELEELLSNLTGAGAARFAARYAAAEGVAVTAVEAAVTAGLLSQGSLTKLEAS